MSREQVPPAPPLLRSEAGCGNLLGFPVVIVNDAAKRQCQVGQEMMGADHPTHRKIRDRRIDVGHQMQTSRPDP